MKQACKWFVTGLVLASVLGCSKPEDPIPEQVGSVVEQQRATVAKEQPPKGPVTLRVTWPPGRRVVNQVEWFQKSETYFPMTPQPLRQQTVSTQLYTLTAVKELADGGKELLLELGDISMATRLGEKQLFDYNSASDGANDPSNPVAVALGSVPGRQFNPVLNANGEMQSVPGLTEFVDEISRGAPAQARPLITAMYAEESIRQWVELGRALPVAAVRLGDSWPGQEEFSLGVLGSIKLDANNTFSGWEHRQNRLCALLMSSGTPTGTEPRSGGPLGMQTTVGGGESLGKTWTDPKMGQFVESEIKQRMTLLMHMGVVGGSAPITNLLEQTVHLRLIEATP